MGVYITNAGSNPMGGGNPGSAYALVINPDGSLNIGSITQNISVTNQANRSTIYTNRYTANSGVPTFLSGQAIPNDFGFVVKALTTNSTQIGVGSNFGVIGSAYNLYPGDGVSLRIDNLNRIQFVTITNGDGVEIISET